MSVPSYERELADLVEDIANAKDRQGVTVLLGAGASVTAGIPTALGFCDRIRERHDRAYQRANVKGRVGYQALMGELTEVQRRALLAETIDAARINWTHLALAGLMRDGYVTRVLTPNFDSLIVQACALLNVFPAVYDFTASSLLSRAHIPSPAVYYLHGQRTGARLLNTDAECKAHAANLRPAFDEATPNRLWLVVGYSGENDPVFDRLIRERSFEGGLYWAMHRDEKKPAAHLTSGFLDADRSIFLLPGYDADTLFIQLAHRLGAFPPDLVHDPFQHLQATYDRIVEDEPEEARARNLLAGARERVQRAADSEQREQETVPTAPTDLTDLRLALATGNPDRVVTAWEASDKANGELRELAADARSEQGVAVVREARRTADAGKARSLFQQAAERYEQAAALKADNHEALFMWGDALDEMARRSEDAGEARTLFRQAIECYEQAVAVKPDKHEAFHYWGIALDQIARRTADAGEARTLFRQAIECYEQAVAGKPDKHWVIYNWGVALDQIARRTADAGEARTLVRQAIERYEQAVAIKPDDHEMLSNWGAALSEIASRLQEEDAEQSRTIFRQAIERYEQAVAIKPDDHEVFSNWGAALAGIASRTVDADEARSLFMQAAERYEQAAAVKPDYHEALGNWGVALNEIAQRLPEGKAEPVWTEAEAVLQRALALEPDKTYNLACLHAVRGNAGEARRLLETGHAAGTLPDPDHLRADRDLDKVRDEPWFAALLEPHG